MQFSVFAVGKFAPERPQPRAHLLGFCLRFRFWSKFISVLRFSSTFYTVLRFLICSNAPLSLSKRDDLPKKMITNVFFLITMLLLNLRSRRKRLRPIGTEYLGYVRDKRADTFKQTSTSRMKFSTRESNKVGSFSDCIRKWRPWEKNIKQTSVLTYTHRDQFIKGHAWIVTKPLYFDRATGNMAYDK